MKQLEIKSLSQLDPSNLRAIIEDFLFVPLGRVKAESRIRSENESDSEATAKLFQFHQYLIQFLENSQNSETRAIGSRNRRNKVF